MTRKKAPVPYGLVLFASVTALFIVLKLTGAVDWSWFWVLSPLWVPLIFTGIMATIFIVLAVSFRARYDREKEAHDELLD